MVKVIVVGLDGASPFLIERWKEYLPNLRNIMIEGVSGILESSDPPITSPAWICFFTGKNPGKIGIFDFINLMKNKTSEIVNFTMLETPTIWEILSAQKKRVGLLGVPCTYPPIEVNGFIVSGNPAPFSRKDYTFPPELRKELDKIVDGYEVDIAVTSPKDMKWGEEEFLREVQRLHQKKVTSAVYLMKRYPWDFFMVVFTALDVVQHHFWHYMDPSHPKYDPEKAKIYGDVIRLWYIRMDNTISEIKKYVKKDTYLLIMSDHGAGPLYRTFLVNEWLRKQGLLTLNKNVNPNFFVSVLLKWSKYFFFNYLGSSVIRKILSVMPASFQLKGTVQASLKREANGVLSIVDWSQTKAFAFGVGPAGKIYLNEENIENLGYQTLRSKVIEKLSQIKNELGHNCVIKIYKKEEIYQGKHVDVAPDLIFYLFIDKILYEVSGKINYGKLFDDRDLSGGHTKEGFWALIGPEVKKNMKLNARIIDLAPTILYLLEVPIQMDMDGKLLKDGLLLTREEEYRNYSINVRRAKVMYSEREKEKIIRRLKGLGYI